MTRLVIVQRVLPLYRVPVFEGLAELELGEVHVVAGMPSANEGIRCASSLKRVTLHRVRNLVVHGLAGPITYQRGLLKILQSLNPDVAIFEANPRLASSWLALAQLRRRGKPVLGWGLGELPRHGSRIAVGVRAFLATRFVRRFDGAVAYSSKAAKDFCRMGVPSDRVVVAHNSTDTSEADMFWRRLAGDRCWVPGWRSENRLASDLPVVIFVGRLNAGKNIENLINVAAELSSQMQLLIVGDGPQKAQLDTLARDRAANAVFLGHRTGEALARAFLASDLFVLPGAGGLALHQAMCYGLPVVATFGDGTEGDLIQPGRNGALLPDADEKTLENAVDGLLRDRAKLLSMGAASRQIIDSRFRMQSMIDNMGKLVRQVARGN